MSQVLKMNLNYFSFKHEFTYFSQTQKERKIFLYKNLHHETSLNFNENASLLIFYLPKILEVS
jgi:hypothetical protein